MKSCCKVSRKAKKAYRNSCMETHKMHLQRWLTFLPMSTNVCWPLLLNFLPCFYNNIISNIRSTDHNLGYPAGHPVRGSVHTHQTNRAVKMRPSVILKLSTHCKEDTTSSFYVRAYLIFGKEVRLSAIITVLLSL